MKKLLKMWFCKLWRNHEWTSKSIQKVPGITVDNFWEYARMYCKRCGKISKKSIEAKN